MNLYFALNFNKPLLKTVGIFLIICTLSSALVKAQSYSITGKVKSFSTQLQLPNATITIREVSTNELIKGTVSDLNGNFKIDIIRGSYLVVLSYVGYEPASRAINLKSSNTKLGTIFLKPIAINLNSVEVSERSVPVIRKGDTTQYNAEAYKINPDASARDLLEKMPGMTMKDGKLQAEGEQISKVYVDGRMFFGDDPNAALTNLPANMIDKVEVFNNQSDQARFTGFDDGNHSKALNVVTKQQFRNGTFGKLYAGYGTENKYAAGGALNSFNNNRRITVIGQSNNVNLQNFAIEDLAGLMNSGGRPSGPPPANSPKGGPGGPGDSGGGGDRPSPGSNINNLLINEQCGITQTNSIGINYSDLWFDKVEVTGSYFFNKSKNTNNSSLVQQYLLDELAGRSYDADENSVTDNTNHRFNLKLDYRINDRNSILLQTSLSLQQNNSDGLSDARSLFYDTILTHTLTCSGHDADAVKLTNSVLYRHSFEKKGRTLSFNLSQSQQLQCGDSYSNSINALTELTGDTTRQNIATDVNKQTYSFSVAYTEPISKYISLQVGTKSYLNDDRSETGAFVYDPSFLKYTFDNSMSNYTKSKYIANQANADLRYRNGKHTVIISGALQQSELEAEQYFPTSRTDGHSFLDFLPMAMWTYRMGPREDIRMFYQTSSALPEIDDLQDVIDYSDPTRLTSGNSSLLPQKQHNFNIGFMNSNSEQNTIKFGILNFGYTDGYIGSSVIISPTDTLYAGTVAIAPGVRYTSPVNLDGYYNFNTFLTYGFPFNLIKSNLNLNVSLSYSSIPGLINYEENVTNSASAGLGLMASSSISEKMDFSVSINGQYNQANNELSSTTDTRYYNQTSSVKLYYNFVGDYIFKAEIQHQYYTGDDSYDDSYIIVNLSLGSKLFKDKSGEISILVNDLLNQNSSITRSVTESYVQDSNTNMLKRYVMVNFTYNLKVFK